MDNRLKKIFFQFSRVFRIESKNLPIFISLIILSSLFWTLKILSKEYTTTISMPLYFTDLPSDKLLVEKNDIILKLHVRASGFVLLANKLSFSSHVDLSVTDFLKQRKGKYWEYYWIGSQSLGDIQDLLSEDITLLNLKPGRIELLFSDKKNKMVPVQLKSNINFKSMFRKKAEIKLEPDHVLISGPESVLSAINQIFTKKLSLDDIDQSQSGTISLAKAQHPELVFNHLDVEWKLEVEQFTEGNMQIPLTIKGVPNGYELRIFPKNIDINYLVSLDEFSLINRNMFELEVNYVSNKNRLPIELVKSSELVNNVRFYPNKVEYILIKK